MRTLLLTLLLTPLLLLSPTSYAFSIPEPDGFVTDIAKVLSLQEEQQMEAELAAYRSETSNEIAVLILPSLEGEEIAQLTTDIGRQWGVGSSEHDNGILLLIALEDRQLFIATGYGLEGAVPDIVAKHIIDTEITPAFREGAFADGILRGIQALQQQIGGEYSIDQMEKDWPLFVWPLAIVVGISFILFLYISVQSVLGFIIGVSPSRSWAEGAITGAVVGFVLGGFAGMLFAGAIGGFLDYVASSLYATSPAFQAFVKKLKKTRSVESSRWRGGGFGGGGSSSGGGGFGGGSFGGGGAGGRW